MQFGRESFGAQCPLGTGTAHPRRGANEWNKTGDTHMRFLCRQSELLAVSPYLGETPPPAPPAPKHPCPGGLLRILVLGKCCSIHKMHVTLFKKPFSRVNTCLKDPCHPQESIDAANCQEGSKIAGSPPPLPRDKQTCQSFRFHMCRCFAVMSTWPNVA